MSIEASLLTPQAIFVLPPTRDRHELNFLQRWDLLEPPGKLVAVHSGHADVEQCDLWRLLLHQAER